MPKTARSLGLYEQTFPPMPVRTWQKQLCSDWFETDTDFVARIIQQPLQMPFVVMNTYDHLLEY
jgi:hypothetical protein